MPFDIKKRRKELNLTFEEIGKFVGVGKGTVKKWESGCIRNMRRDKIIKLAEVLKVSPMDILSMDDIKLFPTQKKTPLTNEIKEKYHEFILSVFDAKEVSPSIIIYKDTELILITPNDEQLEHILQLG